VATAPAPPVSGVPLARYPVNSSDRLRIAVALLLAAAAGLAMWLPAVVVTEPGRVEQGSVRASVAVPLLWNSPARWLLAVAGLGALVALVAAWAIPAAQQARRGPGKRAWLVTGGAIAAMAAPFALLSQLQPGEAIGPGPTLGWLCLVLLALAPWVTGKSRATGAGWLGRLLFGIAVAATLLLSLAPFAWAVVSSFKTNDELFRTPTVYWPGSLYLGHLQAVFANDDFLYAVRNSTIVALLSVALALAAGCLGAYAVARMRFRGRSLVLYLILAMTAFPPIAILGSLFQVIRAADLYNRIPGLVLSYQIFTLPFAVWVLASFFRSLPVELEDAALVDGATPWQALAHIVLPLSLPGLVTVGLLTFIGAWNEYLFALTFTQDMQARTIQPVIASFSGQGQYDYPWGSIMAASVLVTAPLLVLVVMFQRWILDGLTAGAVRG
jgi:trehalose/maltose transport system permease protein